jgi:hypothetical protein
MIYSEVPKKYNKLRRKAWDAGKYWDRSNPDSIVDQDGNKLFQMLALIEVSFNDWEPIKPKRYA